MIFDFNTFHCLLLYAKCDWYDLVWRESSTRVNISVDIGLLFLITGQLDPAVAMQSNSSSIRNYREE